mgnify:CR=1 FL=1
MTTTTRPTLTPLLLAVLALLSAFTPLSIDMYLPALPVITVDLRGSVGDIQLTLSMFMVAFGFGQIFYGPAGDRFGRRPVILSGLLVYVLASVGCAFAASAGQLIVLRFLQGLAACGGVVLARTMVRDMAERDEAARAMSLMLAATSIAPMLAPLIGGQILWFAGWRAIFWALAGVGVEVLDGALCAGLRLVAGGLEHGVGNTISDSRCPVYDLVDTCGFDVVGILRVGEHHVDSIAHHEAEVAACAPPRRRRCGAAHGAACARVVARAQHGRSVGGAAAWDGGDVRGGGRRG